MQLELHNGHWIKINDYENIKTKILAILKEELPEEAHNVEAIKIILNQMVEDVEIIKIFLPNPAEYKK